MPIDYSKWDKIELSDDSDIEVHPNVDKKSFIKWKQRDIHEKRAQRNIEIKSILVQLTMYAKLNERVDYLLDNLDSAKLTDQTAVTSKLNENFDSKEKFDFDKLVKEKGDTLRKGLGDLTFDKDESANEPPYNEMIEDLFVQIKEDHPEAAKDHEKMKQYITEHRKKIDDILSKQTIKLDELLYQKSMLISSDDIRTGFDRSFLNKNKEQTPTEKGSQTVTTTETINNPGSTENSEKSSSKVDALDDLTLLPATEKFSKIKINDLQASAKYLRENINIATEQQKDALIMTAFDAQLSEDSARARQIIHQSLLLQYVSQLAGPNGGSDNVRRAIELFFSKIGDKSSPASVGFSQDVTNTFNHIQTRCKVIREEQKQNATEEGDDEGVIQLKSLDEGTDLTVTIPEEGTEEYEIFTTKLPQEMQAAVKTESLEEVNKVFAKYSVEEAEEILNVFNEAKVIGISGYLENEEEFKELQDQYHEQEESKENVPESEPTGNQETSTTDIVD